MMARPTLLNDELTKAICDPIREKGAPLEAAAEAVGVAKRTAWDWLARGRQGREPYTTFSQAVERARATWEINALGKLEDIELYVQDPKAANTAAQNIRWKLERLRRDTYGLQVTMKVAETKSFLLDKVEAVCERLGQREVLIALLQELSGGSDPAAGEAAEGAVFH